MRDINDLPEILLKYIDEGLEQHNELHIIAVLMVGKKAIEEWLERS